MVKNKIIYFVITAILTIFATFFYSLTDNNNLLSISLIPGVIATALLIMSRKNKIFDYNLLQSSSIFLLPQFIIHPNTYRFIPVIILFIIFLSNSAFKNKYTIASLVLLTSSLIISSGSYILNLAIVLALGVIIGNLR